MPAVDGDVVRILSELAATATGRRFRLAGGTALALQLGHRRSNDLDYFAFTPRVNSASVLADIERLKPAIGTAVIASVESGQLDVEVGPSKRKLSFIAYPFPPLTDPVEIHGQRCSSAIEVAAMKAYTIGRRAAARDYVDIEAAITLAGTDIGDVIAEASRRFVLDGEPVFSERLFLQQIVDVSDISDSSGLVLLRSTWDEIVASLRQIVASYVNRQIG